ncbi:MAG: hypothetical protein WBP45_16035 [Daejeonella sp.]
MKGISYIIDEKGEKSAIVIDMHVYHEQLQDFLDGLEAESRFNEPQEEYKKVMDSLVQTKKNA